MATQNLSISVENLAPQSGTSLTPVWAGFHNGNFDTFDPGAVATEGLERIAEDGNTAVISNEFNTSGFGDVDTVVGGAPIAPGATARQTVTVDSSQGRYFNYAAMVLPSNDTFIANSNPLAFEIFDAQGNFVGAEFTVGGDRAYDAGTEVNDELPENTAFFGQQTPDTGVEENGVVTLATGFNPAGSGGILDSPDFANADYTQPGYQFARIRVANLVQGTRRSDVLSGTDAQDDIFAGRGNDLIRSGEGNDRIYAGRGRDTIFVGSGNNIIKAGRGNDRVIAGDGDNIINTGSGRDRVIVGDGDNTIETGSGSDIIVSGSGNNSIDAGTGRDFVFAGDGNDTFVLNAGRGQVNIFNYDINDQFSLGKGLSSDEALDVSTRGSNTIISNGDDVLATLRGVQVNTVDFA